MFTRAAAQARFTIKGTVLMPERHWLAVSHLADRMHGWQNDWT